MMMCYLKYYICCLLTIPSHCWVLNNEYVDMIVPQISKVNPHSTRYLLDCTQDYFTNQLVDHFNKSDGRTWHQRYLYGQNCFQDGGPLILEIGGEWQIQCLNSPARKLACALNGLYIYVEHRFYGRSFPFPPFRTGDREPSTVDELEYLSSRQAIADIVRLKHHVNTNNKQTYVVGCSYGGSLAFWARQLHPNLIDAAVALSPPLVAQLDFRKYWKLSAQALNKISKSTCGDYLMSRDFENELYSLFDIKMFDPSSMREFEKKSGMCENSLDGLCMADKIVRYLVKEYGEQVYSYAQTTHTQTHSIDSTCNSTRNIEKDVQSFLRVKFPTFKRVGQQCIDAQVFHDNVFSTKQIAKKKIKAKQEKLDNWAWFWQKCSEFGWMKPDAVENIESYTNRICRLGDDCSKITKIKITNCRNYNVGFHRVKKNIEITNNHYKLDDWNDKFTLIVNGEHDPWRELSKGAKVATHLEPNVSHCPDNLAVDDLLTSRLKQWFYWLNDWTNANPIKFPMRNNSTYDIYGNATN